MIGDLYSAVVLRKDKSFYAFVNLSDPEECEYLEKHKNKYKLYGKKFAIVPEVERRRRGIQYTNEERELFPFLKNHGYSIEAIAKKVNKEVFYVRNFFQK